MSNVTRNHFFPLFLVSKKHNNYILFMVTVSSNHQHHLTMMTTADFDCTVRSDGYYANPTSCSQYYVCVAKMTLLTDCHPGLLFNKATLYCDFPDHVTCKTSNTAPVIISTELCIFSNILTRIKMYDHTLYVKQFRVVYSY